MLDTQTELSPDLIRTKLLQVAEQYLPKLPDLLQQMATKAEPMAKMAITAAKPFLPKLGTGLLSAIENAPDEKILELVRFVEGVASWLREEEAASLSSPSNESSS